MAKIVCVLYDDPIDGHPASYTRDTIPKITVYPNGQTTPTPKSIDLKPSEMLGGVSQGHTLVVASDKDGPDYRLDKELHDADILISQPFWPAYLTADRIAKAPKRKLALTACLGSDHVDYRPPSSAALPLLKSSTVYCQLTTPKLTRKICCRSELEKRHQVPLSLRKRARVRAFQMSLYQFWLLYHLKYSKLCNLSSTTL